MLEPSSDPAGRQPPRQPCPFAPLRVYHGPRWISAALFVSLLTLLTGCRTASPSAPSRHFSEAPYVDVGLRFASWDCIFLTQPPLRENGFESIFTRETIGPALARLSAGREMCAVVVHAEHEGEALGGVVQDWTAMLRAAGFARVVFLRAGFAGDSLNGLEILEDQRAQAAQ